MPPGTFPPQVLQSRQAEAAVEQAQAAIEQAQANLEQGKANRDLARITAGGSPPPQVLKNPTTSAD